MIKKNTNFVSGATLSPLELEQTRHANRISFTAESDAALRAYTLCVSPLSQDANAFADPKTQVAFLKQIHKSQGRGGMLYPSPSSRYTMGLYLVM